MKSLFSLDEAKVLGNYFLSHPLVEKIEVFGSLSRGSLGYDFDLILIVPEEISNLFFKHTLRRIKLHFYLKKFFPLIYFLNLGPSYSRLKISKKILGRNFVKNAEKSFGAKNKIDLFLLPQGWQNQPEEFQKKLPHIDPKFMWNIAKDSRILC